MSVPVLCLVCADCHVEIVEVSATVKQAATAVQIVLRGSMRAQSMSSMWTILLDVIRPHSISNTIDRILLLSKQIGEYNSVTPQVNVL